MLAGQQFGRYEIRGKIGEGGMGEVYSAHDSLLGRSVAIKLLPNEFVSDEDRRSRFRQEARTTSALNHPNIITIYEIGDNEHGSFLATELIEGRTLRQIISSESITLARILRIIEQTANALDAAHHAKIVHRDIKPENIMVRRDAIVKVLDFGLAKPTGVFKNGDGSKTIPGTVMGSARYMSPEQARGLDVDERTDIWSLGVVLYEMLTGTAPFNGETTADTIASVIYREPEPIGEILPNTPPELLRILRKALQKDREERYQSVKDFALDIKDLLYDIDHANSAGRSAHLTGSPNISENPTMIHRTDSAGYPTKHATGILTRMPYDTTWRKSWAAKLVFGSIGAFALMVFVGFGAYSWFDTREQLVSGAFDRPQISRINSDGKVTLPALSPDGKYAAYASGEVGNQSLVVRQISTDSIVTVVPASNLNFSAVTFSPSGDRVYYCQTRSDFLVNTLYQVPTLGGPSRKLIEDVDSVVTFSPDGKRFGFLRHTPNTNEDVIFTVDAATLEMERLISSTDAGYDFFSPRMAWSPDGRTILLGAGKRPSGSVSDMTIGEISIAEKTFKPLNTTKFITVGSFAWFADGSGFLCTGRETQTSPVQIWRASYPGLDFHQVTNDFNDYMEVGLSADGNTILTLKGDTTSSLWRFSPANKEAVQLTTEGRYYEGFNGLVQKNDGSLLFSRKQEKEGHLWQADQDGKNGKPLVEEKGFSGAPVVTSDGRHIVFIKEKDKVSRIWRMDADGSNPVQLTENDPAFSDFQPQVTADGKTVIFQRRISNVDWMTLMKISIDGGNSEPFHSIEGWSIAQPRLSPDGKFIAYTTFNLISFEKKLQISSLDGNSFGKVEGDLEYNLINQFWWTPDSKSLTVLTSRGGTPNLWRLPTDGSAPTPITDFKTSRIFNFAWAADGKSLLLARGNTANDLILIRETAGSTDRAGAPRTGGQRRSTL